MTALALLALGLLWWVMFAMSFFVGVAFICGTRTSGFAAHLVDGTLHINNWGGLTQGWRNRGWRVLPANHQSLAGVRRPWFDWAAGPWPRGHTWVPLWPFVVVMGAAGLWMLHRVKVVRGGGECPMCGYDTRGLKGLGTCPECGGGLEGN